MLRPRLPSVIGLHGPERVGKDAVTRALMSLCPRAEHIKFAHELYAEVHARFPELADIEDARKDEPLAILGGRSKRDVLIEIAQGRRAIDPDYWVKRFVERAVHAMRFGRLVVCSDVRQQNERDAIDQLGGVVIGLRRPGVSFRGGPTSTDHYAEWCCHVIDNDGTEDDLTHKVSAVLREIGFDLEELQRGRFAA